MLKPLACWMLAAAALATGPAIACRGNSQVPAHGQAAGYDVLAVEVTGVHLSAYEDYQAATLGLQPWPTGEDGEEALYPVSSTPAFQVRVLVHSASGETGEAVREFTLGGCGVRVPEPRERGLLFVSPSGSVGAVWQDREPELARWLDELGLAFRQAP
jgi:hypothetical protein